jgi:hypothetical protein
MRKLLGLRGVMVSSVSLSAMVGGWSEILVGDGGGDKSAVA